MPDMSLPPDAVYPFADLSLSKRLERAEALFSVHFVAARARLIPDSGATWTEVAGAFAIYDGVGSPLTQTYGLGLFEPATAADLEAIEAFYAECGAATFHEVSPLGDPGLPTLLASRGYRPCEFTSVMYRPIGADTGGVPPRSGGGAAPAITVRPVDKGEEALYGRLATEGVREFGIGDFMSDYARVSASTEGVRLFLAEVDGEAIAGGALSLTGGVAHLAGASTIPSGRRRGAQLALLEARLQHAAAHGCDIALIGTGPGTGSQRNAERHGFRIAYTRIKWTR
jgi:GNAT superfamily N-acetyltransferase